MWQKCPICDGEGRVTSNGLSSSVHQVCSVCKGAKIISQLNGLSPNSIDKEQQKKLLTEIMEADEKDGLYKTNNMAQQTAVDYLIEQLWAPCRGIPSHIIEQAKQMEKEQIIKFAEFVAAHPDKNKNYLGEMLHAKSKYDEAVRTIDLLEQYYNETYKKE